MAGQAAEITRFGYEPDYVTEPGEILQETIDSLGISQKELAARTDYTTKHVNQLISGKARITADAALRLEKAVGVPASFWSNLETQFQDRRVRLANSQASESELVWLDGIPVKELVRRGAIPSFKSRPEQLQATLAFFGVASVDAWRAGWRRNQIAFRKSGGVQDCSGGIAAWFRLAELEATKLDCFTFDAVAFRRALREIRSLTDLSPSQFVPRMRPLCGASGVALVIVPEIPGSPVTGACRWLPNDRAMIALNLWGKKNDHFWFTFFHEAGHLLNDPCDEVFVDVEYSDEPCERPANQFADEILIPTEYAPRLKTLRTKNAVRNLAVQIGVHPAIVVGRLQRDGTIPFTHMNDLRVRLDWAKSTDSTTSQANASRSAM